MSTRRKMKIQSEFRRKIIFISILIIINLPMGFKFASEQKAVYFGPHPICPNALSD
ncbi:MAG: hypothetical protein ACTSO6_15395 [Promethearchaeota archaeon]